MEIPKEIVALSHDAEGQIVIAKSFVITTQGDYQLAADQLRQIKQKGKILEEQRKNMTKPLDDSKKAIMDFFRKPGEFLTEAESIIKGAMLLYSKAEEARRQEKERKARAEAERIREEAQAKAEKEQEEARKQAEEAAAIARDMGDEELAKQIMEEETSPVAQIVILPEVQAAIAPKVQGASIRKTFSCEVVDKMALVRAILEGTAHPRFLVPDMAALRNEATYAREEFNIPGCKVVIKEIVASR